MLTKNSGQGDILQYNFNNRYLDDQDLAKPSTEVKQQISQYTKNKLNELIGNKLVVNSQHQSELNTSGNQPHYIRYTPNNQVMGTNSGANQRIIKMHTVQKDPIAPAQFKHKKVAKGQASPPPTIMHSPPRKLTTQDQLDWKVPPCISNWKNAKGYTIPIEMRLKADGRTLINHTINEKHAKFTNALYMVERESRLELEERNKIQKSMAYKEHQIKEQEMREQAQRAREEKQKLLMQQAEQQESKETQLKPEEVEEKEKRDELRYLRKREIERESRLEAAGYKKAKAVRDMERDISEKVALGQAQPTVSELQFDQRMFNQTAGLGQGYGSDDDNNVYDKPLFVDRTAASIYKNVKEFPDDEEENNQNQGIERMLKQPARGFEGSEKNKGVSRTKPVEFEKFVEKAVDQSQQYGDTLDKKRRI